MYDDPDYYDEEEKIREWAEKKIAARNEFRQTVVVLAAVALFLWGIWAVTGAGFVWPVFPMGGLMIAVVASYVDYHNKYGGGYNRQQNEIEREIAKEVAREQERMARLHGTDYGDDLYDEGKRKRKNDEY